MNARTLPFGPPGHDGMDETIDIAIIGTGFAGLGWRSACVKQA